MAWNALLLALVLVTGGRVQAADAPLRPAAPEQGPAAVGAALRAVPPAPGPAASAASRRTVRATQHTAGATTGAIAGVVTDETGHTDREGRHVFTTWTAKAYGTYAAPWDVRVTPLLRHQSGQPFGRTIVTTLPGYGSLRILAEPVGARRTDHVTVVDVRIEKSIRLSGSRRVAAFADVFNVLNANPELNANWASGPAFLQPLAILPPRIARVGTKVEW